MAMETKMSNDINHDNSLGKGEVDSSILSGSTTKAHKTRAFEADENSVSATSGRTEREDGSSNDGESVDSDRALFTLRRDLTNKRNAEPDKAEREQLTTLINNMDGLIRDPADNALRAQFARNVAAYERRRAGGAQ
jgi:hypothetical protein